ncbi:MAG TPA: ATP-binding protein [Candidatus Synoicihabitans sp.]|nr:ATP-binding protein [Candidatus Synoicihabitans sp.]
MRLLLLRPSAALRTAVRWCGTALLCAGLAAAPAAAATTAEAGRLMSQMFLPEDYRGETQMSDVVQTPDGLIYGATLGAVHEYDGGSWRSIPVPTSWIMDLDVDAQGRVYVTGEDEFGLLEPDADGHMRYRSLVELVPPELRPLGRLWSVFAFEGAAYWATDDVVIRWRDGLLRTWVFPDTEARRALYRGGQHLYFCTTDTGLFRLAGEEWAPVSVDPQVKKLPIAIFDNWNGAGLTFSLSNGSFWRLDAAGTATEWPTELATVVASVQGARLIDAVRLRDDRLAIVTKVAGVFVLDQSGHIDLRFGTHGGLPVLNLFSATQDREGGLWIGTARGAVRIELDPSLTVFDQSNGAPPGGMYMMARYEGVLYACGEDGLYRFTNATAGAQGRFERVPDTRGFMPYDLLTHRSGLVVVGDAGLFRYADGVMHHDFDAPHSLNTVAASTTDPDRVFVGGIGFVHTLRWDGTAWRDEGPVAAMKDDARTIVEDEHGVAWIGTPSRGVVRIRRTGPLAPWQSAQVDLFDEARGLPAGHEWVAAAHTSLGPLFAHARGVSAPDATGERLIPARALADAGVDGRYTYPLAPGKGAALWMQFGYPPAGDTPVIGGLLPLPGGGWQWRELPAAVYPALGFLGAGELIWEPAGGGEGVLWIQGQQSIVRCDLNGALLSRRAAAPAVIMRSVQRAGRGFPLRPEEPPVLDYVREPLRVRFASPVYAPGGALEYQFQLRGFAEHWSDWTTNPEAVFTNIPGGSYELVVRARRSGGLPGPEAGWTFRIRPKWWQRSPAVLGLIVALGGLVWALVRWRVAVVERERARLEVVVRERTEELSHERDRAEAANRAKTMFLASMSHELRTPLHAILGYSQLLSANHTIPPEARGRLQIVANSGHHLLRLINEVLDLSKIEAGKLELNLAPFDLPRFVTETVHGQEMRAQAKGLIFRHPELAGLPAIVNGDAQKLRQILDNLLGNAVKFTDTGEVRLSIVPLQAGRLHFEISDTGRGIAPDDVQRLFEPFTQARSDAPPAERGSGLGLTIAHRLVALMGGDLHVASKLGEGSRFWFDLDLPVDAAIAGEHRPGRTFIGYDGPRRRVLAIDDVEANRLLFHDLLAPLGFEVSLAASAFQALAALEHVRPDLVLLDLRMPVMDGFELARKIRADHRLEGVRILAASASVFGHDPSEALAAGCDGFISKPFLPEEFLARVGELLALSWHEAPSSVQSTTEALSPALLEELHAAAHGGDVVALRDAFARLRQQHPHAAALDEIERAIDSFDFGRVRALTRLQPRAGES